MKVLFSFIWYAILNSLRVSCFIRSKEPLKDIVEQNIKLKKVKPFIISPFSQKKIGSLAFFFPFSFRLCGERIVFSPVYLS